MRRFKIKTAEEETAPCEIESKILKILGNNHKIPCDFNNSTYDLRGIYTYRGRVYVLSNYDMPFDEVADVYQEVILDKIEKGDYVLNRAMQ